MLLVFAAATSCYLIARPPYSERQYRLGMEEYERGRYDVAASSFTRALDVVPNSPEILYARGRAHQRMDEIDAALIDYRKAEKLKPDGKIMACLGYCLNRRKQHQAAISLYERAIGYGYESAELYNNIGYSYIQWSKLDPALKNLDKAIELNPSLQAAYQNRARVELEFVLRGERRYLDRAVADIQKAVELGPESAELWRDSARILAIAANGDKRWIEPALASLENAVRLGYAPQTLTRDVVFKSLQHTTRFEALSSIQSLNRQPSNATRLLDPVPDDGR